MRGRCGLCCMATHVMDIAQRRGRRCLATLGVAAHVQPPLNLRRVVLLPDALFTQLLQMLLTTGPAEERRRCTVKAVDALSENENGQIHGPHQRRSDQRRGNVALPALAALLPKHMGYLALSADCREGGEGAGRGSAQGSG